VRADHKFGPRGRSGNFVDAQRRGVTGKDHPWLAHAIQLLEYFLLKRHAFEYGFDNQVNV
jgi:hypothetical protein